MSIEAMAWAWEQPVPPITKLVLLALADDATPDGEVWPALNRIATKCGVTKPDLSRRMRYSAARGYLSLSNFPTSAVILNLKGRP